MSSWLSLPISNPFKFEENSSENQQNQQDKEEEDQLNSSPSHGSGSVKEDLSELGKTLSRQLWGVASFLAPPPSPPSTTSSASTSASSLGSATEASGDSSSSQRLLGVRNDIAEISGSLKSGFSLISTNKAVNEISRLASNLLQFDEKDDKEEVSGDDFESGVAGVTEEALEFVKEISLRPECWIDFPLSLDDKDFDMSNAQKEHALQVEHLAPSLADLRMKLCPHHMKEETFWSIYFILLHPRLNEHDSELLSTPQILKARDVLLQTVRNRKNENLQTSNEENLSLEVDEKGDNAQEDCSLVQEKRVLSENVNAEHQEDVDVDVDQWLEEDVETGTSYTGRNHLGDEKDVSFSDLEDDDNDSTSQQGGASPVGNVQLSSPNDSSGWVQLSESSGAGGGRKKTVQQASRDKDSEGEGSSEWLTIDESDSDSVGTS